MEIPDSFDLAFTSRVEDAIAAHRKQDESFARAWKEQGDLLSAFLETLHTKQRKLFDQMAEKNADIEIICDTVRYRQGMIDAAFLLHYMGLLKE